MTIDNEKLKRLVAHYGETRNYPVKSYLPMFCEDNGLNYIQWNTYLRGAQKIGMKIVYDLLNIFPNLNLNWLFKDEENMFLINEYENNDEEIHVVNEIDTKYSTEIVDELYKKVEVLSKRMKEINKLSTL